MTAITVRQAYRFALDPTPAQERALRSHAGAARFAWNWGLTKCNVRYAAEGRWYSSFELQKLFNAEKKIDPALAWWAENSKCAYQEAFRDLDKGLLRFTLSRKGKRRGPKMGFPRFKKRGRSRDSFRLTAPRPGQLNCRGAAVTLPRLGIIKTHESTRKLARRLEAGTARVTSATVNRAGSRWYVSFAVEVVRQVWTHQQRSGTAVGVDLGVKVLLTTADSSGVVTHIAGPNALRATLRKLARANRAHARTERGSANRKKAAARLTQVHCRVANVRTDALHKATSALVAKYETVVVEDLHVAAMVRMRPLARAVSDQGFARIREMLAYKTKWSGGRLVVADRFYPSSKTCSACEWRKPSLKLSERTYTCEQCGHTEDRDVNAARNLLKLAASGAESLNACGAQVRPSLAGHRASKQEPGAAQAGQTGTVPPQGETAAARCCAA